MNGRRTPHFQVAVATAAASLLTFAGAAAAQENARPDPQRRVQSETAREQQAVDEVSVTARPIMLAEDGTLTVNAAASRLRLAAVLDTIAAFAKFRIVLSDALENEPVSQSLRAVPWGDGLKQLLAKYDVFYLFSAMDTKSPGAVQAIWVFRRGEGRGLQPVPPLLWASTNELADQLDDPDPGVRAETYESLIERLGPQGLPTVLRGLADPDENVRLSAISTATSEGVEIPIADLHAVLLSDSSYAVRRVALEAIEGLPGAKAIVEALTDDPDEHIRNYARQILEPAVSRDQRKPPR